MITVIGLGFNLGKGNIFYHCCKSVPLRQEIVSDWLKNQQQQEIIKPEFEI